VPFLTRDEIKTGLGLSSARVTEDRTFQLNSDFHIAGGPFSRRAETILIETARVLASSQVSFVVESSVLSKDLLGALNGCGARVLVLHVVADEAVVGDRLRVRASKGWPVDEQMAAWFERGEMNPSIFSPPAGFDAVVEVDTSTGDEPPVQVIEAAVIGLLTSGHVTAGLRSGRKRI
jgi:hypothetical protein